MTGDPLTCSEGGKQHNNDDQGPPNLSAFQCLADLLAHNWKDSFVFMMSLTSQRTN